MELRKRLEWTVPMLVFITAILTSTGCTGLQRTGTSPPSPGFAMPTVKGNESWWAYRFRIDWPEKAPADMAVDLLLAHAVVKPHLEVFAPRLSYWRFHRRAARDATGHQFSLLFYADPATAGEFYAALESSPVLARLRDQAHSGPVGGKAPVGRQGHRTLAVSATDGSGPEIGRVDFIGRRRRREESVQSILHATSPSSRNAPQLPSYSHAEHSRPFDSGLLNEDRNRVEIVAERRESQPQGLKGNAPSSSRGVKDLGPPHPASSGLAFEPFALARRR